MEVPIQSVNHRVQFRSFELDLRTRELYRNGIRLKLQGQPIDVLEMLLERPGELVTREELRKKLWPEDTFVDFEHSLNSTIKRLRDALGDRAGNPRYIETLPRLGYRFVCPVDSATAAGMPDPPEQAGPPHAAEGVSITGFGPAEALVGPPRSAPALAGEVVRQHTSHLKILVPGVFAAVAGILLIRYFGSPLPQPRISDVRQITNDSTWTQKRVVGTDGSRVLLALDPPAFGHVQMQGGEITTIPITVPGFVPGAVEWLGWVSRDGTSVLVYGARHRDPDVTKESLDLWVAATTGTSVRYLTRTGPFGYSAAWSPDGAEVIYSTNDGKIYTIPSTGGEPHLLRALDSTSNHFSFSPDGKTIRFTYHGANRAERRIWEMTSDGTNLHEVLANWRPGAKMYSTNWTPDGKFFLFLLEEFPPRGPANNAAFQLWAIDERRGSLRRHNREPIQLTSGPTSWLGAVPSADSQTIFSQGETFRGELIRFNRKTQQLEPYLNGRSIEGLSFSRDGEYVVYSSYPDGVLWRAKADGSGVQQLGRGAYEHPFTPRLSPDGSQIVFVDMNFGPWRPEIFVMSSEGGTPVRLVPGDTLAELDPTWSPDGTKVAYWTSPEPAKSEGEIRIIDLATRQITLLPRAPGPASSPRWSPDGRYILCTTINDATGVSALELFNLSTHKWKILPIGSLPAAWASWSWDSRFIHWAEWNAEGVSLWRIAVDGDRPERLKNIPGFRSTGWSHSWIGLDPEDNPLLLRNAGSTEVYALTLDRK